MEEIDLHSHRVDEVENILENRFSAYLSWLQRTPEDERGMQDRLKIIVGAGKHSKGGIQKLRPKVENLLAQWENENKHMLGEPETSVEVLNKGCLLVIYSPYRLPENIEGTAHFYCDGCEHSWVSSTWPNCNQKCKNCKNFCKPLEFSPTYTTQY